MITAVLSWSSDETPHIANALGVLCDRPIQRKSVRVNVVRPRVPCRALRASREEGICCRRTSEGRKGPGDAGSRAPMTPVSWSTSGNQRTRRRREDLVIPRSRTRTLDHRVSEETGHVSDTHPKTVAVVLHPVLGSIFTSTMRFSSANDTRKVPWP